MDYLAGYPTPKDYLDRYPTSEDYLDRYPTSITCLINICNSIIEKQIIYSIIRSS